MLLRGLENCFSIQLYSFQIFSPHEAFHPSSSSSSRLLRFFFYVFLPSFRLSFHLNENHLNIIVIFFLHPLDLKLENPSHTTFCNPTSTQSSFFCCYHATFTFSHTIHIIHKMDVFFFSSYSVYSTKLISVGWGWWGKKIAIAVVKEFMGSDLFSVC